MFLQAWDLEHLQGMLFWKVHYIVAFPCEFTRALTFENFARCTRRYFCPVFLPSRVDVGVFDIWIRGACPSRREVHTHTHVHVYVYVYVRIYVYLYIYICTHT